jgi:putative restriction endonuclease
VAARRSAGAQLGTRTVLGQGTFRLAVTSAYSRSCTVTGEHSLPALEAAHIRPYGDGGEHEVSNGLLLRSDIHRLFDTGYVGVTPDYKFVVSDRLRGDYSNGRSYYALVGRPIELPARREEWPRAEALAWHGEAVMAGRADGGLVPAPAAGSAS